MDDRPLLLTSDGVAQVRQALAERSLDGWLLYEFNGQNPIAASLTGLGWNTRRSFVLVPVDGDPVALIQAIESSSWRHWPWEVRRYAGWREMERSLEELLAGRSRIAMEISPGNAVPKMDRVPSGIVELIRGLGAEPVSSGDLVSLFHSVWSDRQLEEHRRSASIVAGVAAEAFARAAEGVRTGTPLREGEVARWIEETLRRSGLESGAGCLVAIGSRAADPHYQPAGEGELIVEGELLLIDLWGRPGRRSVFADQTWMGILAGEVPAEAQEVWETIRDARDGAIAFLAERWRAGVPVRGMEVDDVARGIVTERGFGSRFVHRTGHSIDLALHGSGPNLDNLESRDERILVPGVGFSIEPGVYIPGRLGMRTEVNVHWGETGPEVTPGEIQDEIFRLLP